MMTRGADAGGLAARISRSCGRDTGTPGCCASTCCLAANDGGGGGGVFLAITCRLATVGGGAATRLAVLACTPMTDSRPGGTAARVLTGPCLIWLSFTATAVRPTGWALANARCGTAVTPPRTFRFTYVTLLMVVLLLTTVVL